MANKVVQVFSTLLKVTLFTNNIYFVDLALQQHI